MALVIVIQVSAGDLVGAVQGEVATANVDMGRQVDFVSPGAGGGPDWAGLGAKLGKSAAGIAKMAGQMMRLAPQMILMTIAEWLLEGLLAKLQTPEGKGVADALALIGDAVLDLALTILPKLVTILLQVIAIYTPVAIQLVILIHVVWPVIGPVLAFQWQIFQLMVDLHSKIWDGLIGLATFVGGVLTYVTEKLAAAGRVFGRIIGDLPGAFATLLGSILSTVLGPLQTAMDAISASWDEAQGVFQHAGWSDSYWYGGREYPVGTGPYPNARPGSEYYAIHPAPDDQLVRAVATWTRDNGGRAALDRRMRVAAG